MKEGEGSLFDIMNCGGGEEGLIRGGHFFAEGTRTLFLGKMVFRSKHFIKAMWRMQCEIRTYCMCTTFKSGLSVHVSIRNMHSP